MPSVDELPQRRRIDGVELVTPVPAGDHQAGSLEHVEVLGDRLARHVDTVRREADTELEQRLVVAAGELVEDRPASRRGERVEHITHAPTIGK